MVQATTMFLLLAFAPLVLAFMPRAPLSGHQVAVRPPLGRTGLVQRRASTVEISQQKGEGQQGGRATVFVERAWNSSTMGAMPHDLASFTKEVCAMSATTSVREVLHVCIAMWRYEAFRLFFRERWPVASRCPR